MHVDSRPIPRRCPPSSQPMDLLPPRKRRVRAACSVRALRKKHVDHGADVPSGRRSWAPRRARTPKRTRPAPATDPRSSALWVSMQANLRPCLYLRVSGHTPTYRLNQVPSGKMIAAGMKAPFQLQHLSASPPDLAMFAVLDMSSPSAVSDSRSPSRLRVRDSRPAQCLIAAGGVQLLRVPHINVLAHGGRRALHQGRQGGCQRQAPDPAGDAGLLGQVSARMAVGGAAICVAVSVCCVAGLVGGGPFPCPSVLSVCACACVLVLVGASAVSTASNDALLPARCPPAPCPPPPCRVALPSHLSSFSGH